MSKVADLSIYIETLTKNYTTIDKSILAKSEEKTSKKGYNEALKGVDLSIPKGSIFGLLGPNGAGKSTLINILAGLTIKTSGKVIIAGDDMDKDPIKTRYSIGVVPQEVVLDPFFAVREMLEYYAGYYGVPKSERRTDELLEALSLSDKANANSRKLSGGMKRRVLIAKALVHNPPIVILDEPTAGVDVELRSQLWDYVKELNKKGTTVLLTTHYLEEAEEICDQIAIINKGEIIANDKTSKLIKILDNKQLTITFFEEVKKIPKKLEKFGAHISNDNSITLSYKTSDTSVDELLSYTKDANLRIKDLSTEEPDLEDIFRHLVD